MGSLEKKMHHVDMSNLLIIFQTKLGVLQKHIKGKLNLPLITIKSNPTNLLFDRSLASSQILKLFIKEHSSFRFKYKK